MKKLIYISLVSLIACYTLSLTSCRTVRTVVEYHDSIVYNAVHDTLIEKSRDSIYVEAKGDTVFKTVYKDRFVFKVKSDTIAQTQIVREPYEVIVEKKTVPSWCWWLLAANVVLVVYKVGRIALKIYTQGRV